MKGKKAIVVNKRATDKARKEKRKANYKHAKTLGSSFFLLFFHL